MIPEPAIHHNEQEDNSEDENEGRYSMLKQEEEPKQVAALIAINCELFPIRMCTIARTRCKLQ
jgi:hypothetical protein